MSNIVDWSSIADQKSSGKKKGDDLVFLNSKNLPQTFLPGTQSLVYEAFYDATTKKNRAVQPGDDAEKVSNQYLFYALFYDENEKDKAKNKKVKICCCKQQVAEGIGEVQKILSKMSGGGLTGFVKVTSTGTMKSTKYAVEFVKIGDKDIPVGIWDKLAPEVAKLPKLEEMRDRLLGVKATIWTFNSICFSCLLFCLMEISP
jgi:hypothetical protein